MARVLIESLKAFKKPSGKNQKLIALKNIIKGNICDNCINENRCNIKHLVRPKSCHNWETYEVKIIRRKYPNIMASKLFTETPLVPPDNTVFYLKYSYSNIFQRIFRKILLIIKRKHKL